MSRLVDWYLELKWKIWAVFTYFPIIVKMRPWDYEYMLQMMQFQLKILEKNIHKYSNEIDKTKFEKLYDIHRVIELIQNHLEANYIDRLDEKPSWYESDTLYRQIENDTRTEEQIAKDRELLIRVNEMEEKEWNEIWTILSKGKQAQYGANSWWY